MIRMIFLILFSTSLSLPAQAYKLRLNTVVDKMIKNCGRSGNSYKIHREVSLEQNGRTIKVKEEWWVKNSQRMKVKVSSLEPQNPWSFEIVYNGDQRQTLSSSKNIKSYKISPEFFEPLFFERSSAGMLDRMEKFRFIPSWAKNIPRPNYSGGKTIMKDESFVGLAPSQGSVNYTYGAAKTTTGDPGSTFLFVEQDTWKITKAKLNSTSEFKNQGTQSVDGGLKLPRTQIVSWNDKAARLSLVSAKKVAISDAELSLNTGTSTKIPNVPVVREFYSRFR